MNHTRLRVVNNVSLHIKPRITVDWKYFKENYPPFSIALDGFVRGAPTYTEMGPYANFNHHEGVDRLATRSTCAQVLLAIRQGLFEAFSLGGKPKVNIWVNDCDLDTALAVWILKNYRPNRYPELDFFVDRLVHNEDFLDVTGGTYNRVSPGTISVYEEGNLFLSILNGGGKNKTHIMGYLSRIGEPYNFHRHNGSLSIMPSYKMRGVINQIGQRIALYIRGQGEIRELDTTYEKIGGGKIKGDKQWYLIREIGYDARQVFFKDNVLAFVSVRDNADGTYTYTLGKVSQFVYFPLKSLYDLMNKKEGIPDDQIDRWGGSDIIGGSPRFNHTRMSPETVEEIINDYFRQNKI